MYKAVQQPGPMLKASVVLPGHWCTDQRCIAPLYGNRCDYCGYRGVGSDYTFVPGAGWRRS